MRLSLFLPLLFIVGCAASSDAPAMDPTTGTEPDLPPPSAVPGDLSEVGGDAVETLLTDGSIHVHRVRLAPGDSLPPHQGGERVVYALTELPALVFVTDGRREVRSFADGEVHRHAGGVHSVENASDVESAFVVFERTDEPLAEDAVTDASAASLGEGATDEVVFEDGAVEVHRVTLQPGAGLPADWGYAGAVYALSDYTRSKTTEGGGTETETFAAGSAHYHGADHGAHAAENVGETVAEFLVVVFKR